VRGAPTINNGQALLGAAIADIGVVVQPDALLEPALAGQRLADAPAA
jgi:hypothetical protein